MVLTLAEPVGVNAGFIKTVVRTTEGGANTVKVKAVSAALKRDRVGTNDVVTLSETGGVARFFWDGTRWSAMEGVTSASDLDITVAGS